MGTEVSAAVDRKYGLIKLGGIVGGGGVPFFLASHQFIAAFEVILGFILGVILVGIIGVLVGIIVGARAGGILARIGGGIGGGIVAVGSVLPWARAGIFTASGMEGDGIFTLIAGAALIVIGLAGVMEPVRAKRFRLVAVLVALVALALSAYHVFNLSADGGTIGEGLYVILVGGVIGLAGALASSGPAKTVEQGDGRVPPEIEQGFRK